MDFDPTTVDLSKGVADPAASPAAPVASSSAFDPASVNISKGQTRDQYIKESASNPDFDPADLQPTDPVLARDVYMAASHEPTKVGHILWKNVTGIAKSFYELPLTLAKAGYGIAKAGAPGTMPNPETTGELSGAGASAIADMVSMGQVARRTSSRLLNRMTLGLAGNLDRDLSPSEVDKELAERALANRIQQEVASGDPRAAVRDVTDSEAVASAVPNKEALAATDYSGERAAAMGGVLNPVYYLMPELRGSNLIAGGVLRGAGRAIELGGSILDNPITRRTQHWLPYYAPLVAAHAITSGEVPLHAATALGFGAAAKIGQLIKSGGEFVAQTGRESMAHLSPAESAMYRALQEESGTAPGVFKQTAAAALRGGTETAVRASPLLLTADSPERAGAILGGSFFLGAAGHAAQAMQFATRHAFLDTAVKNTANGGNTVIHLSPDSFTYGHEPSLDQMHESVVSAMPGYDVADINRQRHLEQGRADIYVIPEADFDARYPGKSGWAKNDVINGRDVILYRGADGWEQAKAHEPLHVEYRNLPPETQAVIDKASISRTNPSEFGSEYYTRLYGRPVTLDFNSLPDQSSIGPSKKAILEEMAADTLTHLTIEQITKKPTIKRQLQFTVGRALETIGLPSTTKEVRGIIGVQPTFKAMSILEATLRETARNAEAAGPAYGQQPGTAAKAAAAAKAGTPPASTTAGPPPVQPGTAPQQPATAPAPQQPAPAPTKTVSPVAISEAVKGMAALKFKRGEAQQRVAAAANEAAHLGLDVDASDLLAHALSGKFPTRTAPAPKPAAAAPGPAAAPVSATSLMESVAAPGPEPKLAGLLWHKVLRGDVSLGDIPSQTLLDAREGIRTGTIKTADDFEAFLESKRPAPESKTSEPPVSARKPSATPPVQGGGMENALPEAMSDDTAAAINRAGEEAARAVTPTVKKPRDIERARVLAMAEKHAEVATDPDLVTHRVDPFGKPSITGRRLDAADPLHNRLIQNAGLKPRDVDIANRLMADAGKNVALLDYGSAPVTEDISGISRRKEQAIAPAQKRAKGESAAQHADKNFIPSTIVYNHGSGDNGPSILVRGFSPDKFLHNARQLFPWLEQKGFLSGEDGKPFYSGPDDPKLADDFRAMAENHANGYTGDGAAPVKGTPFTKVKVNPDFKPTEIPADRFRVVNALVGAPYPETGATPRQADIRALSKLNASEPGGNPIWRELGQEKDLLESTIENIKPELVGDLHAEADPTKAIRQSGRLEGAPRQTFSAAGFQPREQSPLPPDAHSEAERLGLKYRGMTMGKLPTFDDPVTGSTITLRDAKTPEAVQAKVEESRRQFGKNSPAAEAGAPRSKVADARRQWLEKGTDSPYFREWFGDSKVVGDDGKPLRVFSGHSNVEMYGPNFDPRKGVAGGFYASEDPKIASNYAVNKMGVREYFEKGDQYRLQLKNGNWGKKLWQEQLTPEQQQKVREFFKDENRGSVYDIEQYWKDYASHDQEARRALARGGLRDLQSIFNFLEGMGENIAYSKEGDAPITERQRKNTFKELLDHLGIKWQSRD